MSTPPVPFADAKYYGSKLSMLGPRNKIGNHSRKKTFANFADFGMIANVFLPPFSIL